MKDSGSYANPINSSFQKFRTTRVNRPPGNWSETAAYGRLVSSTLRDGITIPVASSPNAIHPARAEDWRVGTCLALLLARGCGLGPVHTSAVHRG